MKEHKTLNDLLNKASLEDPYILCEGQDNTIIECPAAKVIKIEAAIYGRTDKSVCQHDAIKSTSCKKKVTSIVQTKCNFKQTCFPSSSTDIYGDPCEGTYKYLNVSYRCIKDERLSSKPLTHLTTPIFTASPRSSPTTEQQELFFTPDAQPSLKSTTHLPTQFLTASPSSSSKTEQQVSFSKTGLEDPYILCEGLNNTFIECPAAKVIKIEAAIYGRTDKSVCQHTEIKSTSCKRTVTSIVQKKCNFNQSCLPISSNIYGDPCTGTYKYLNVSYRCIKDERLSSKPSTHLTTPIFTASPRSSPTTEQQEIFSTTDAQSSLKSTTYLPTQFFTPSPSSSSKTEQRVSFSKTGLAVGISVTIAAIIVIACVFIILRKRKSSSKKEFTQSSTNDKDYIGTQTVAMPRSGDSPEYNDLKVRCETHKYGEQQSKSKPTGDTCYDYIDANEHARETKMFCVEGSPSRSCQEYAMLDPSEKWNTESNTSSYHHTACDDYTALETEKAITNHAAYPPSDLLKYKNNEVKSANNAKRDNYIVLDPKVTGFNRMNDIGNDKFDPNPRDMVHDTTHPVKENTNCYELAKPVLEDGKENTCHKYDGDYGSCQDSDYQLNAGHPTYSEEHVYNHTVDDVYDSTSHNKKSTVPDNTYDYFSGNQTDDDYNMPMKM